MPFPAALLAAGPIAGLMGKIFGGAAKGSAEQRMGENQQALLQAQLQNSDNIARAGLMSNNANTRAGMQNDNATTRASMQNSDNQFRAGLDLQRKQFSQNEPSVQARQAMVGSLLSRIQPIRAPGGGSQMPSIIDALGPEAREAGGLLSQRGLSGLQSGPSKFADIPGVSLPDVTLPDVLNLPPQQLAALQKSGLLEKIMGTLGIAGSAIGAFGSGNTPVTPTSGNGLPIDPYGGG